MKKEKQLMKVEKIPWDLEYQSLLTQRSVARAALHLGIETLPNNTLTVLQDALTQYIERVGRVMGCHVENSGRSSHHVNVLDAIRAVEDCALVGGGGGGGGNAGIMSSGSGSGSGEWEDLARFLLGTDNWLDAIQGVVATDSSSSATGTAFVTDGGAGVGNAGDVAMSRNITGNTSGKQGTVKNVGNTTSGWDAPLDDYDSIPIFPVPMESRYHGSKHASLDSHTTLSDPVRHVVDVDPWIADRTKESMGSETAKRKRDDQDSGAVTQSPMMNIPPTKRLKSHAPNEQQTQQQQQQQQDNNDKEAWTIKQQPQGDSSSQQKDALRPLYIPNFLPPFPPKHTYSKAAIPKVTPVDEFKAEHVRSSLVQLGRSSYWGALPKNRNQGGEESAGVAKEEDVHASRGVFVKVQTAPLDVNEIIMSAGAGAGVGVSVSVGESGEGVGSSGGGGVGPGGGVVEMRGGVKPIVRASNARLSKILEGSMDVH